MFEWGQMSSFLFSHLLLNRPINQVSQVQQAKKAKISSFRVFNEIPIGAVSVQAQARLFQNRLRGA